MHLNGIATGKRETESFRRHETDSRDELVQRVHERYAALTRPRKRVSQAFLACTGRYRRGQIRFSVSWFR